MELLGIAILVLICSAVTWQIVDPSSKLCKFFGHDYSDATSDRNGYWTTKCQRNRCTHEVILKNKKWQEVNNTKQ